MTARPRFLLARARTTTSEFAKGQQNAAFMRLSLQPFHSPTTILDPPAQSFSNRYSAIEMGQPAFESTVNDDAPATRRAASKALLADQVRRLTFFAKASTAMLTREDPREVVAAVYELLRVELRLDCCFNYIVDDTSTRLRLNFAAGMPPDQDPALEWLEFGQAISGMVAQQRTGIVREDVQSEADPMMHVLRALGITAYVCEPLMAGDRLVGTLSVGTRQRTRFPSDEIELLRSITSPLAYALDRRRLISGLNLLRQRAERLQALTSALSTSATPSEVANAVIEHTTAMFGAVGTVITRLSRQGNALEILDARAMPGKYREEWAQFPLDADVPLAEVARTGTAITIESPEEWARRYPSLAGMLEASGQHSLIVVPLVIESRTIGSMGVAFDRPRRFTSDDNNLTEIVAQQCAQALERARLLEAEQASRHAAESADREKAELLASVSHDLRTPLNAIGGYVQLLQMGIRGPLTEEQQQDLARISGNQRHLLHLVEELLRFSALTSPSRPVEITRIPAVEALKTAVESVMPQAEMKGITLAVSVDEDLAAHADPERVQQILMNILANAVKFTPPDGRIELSAQACGADSIALRITDSGPGIPPGMQALIFEPFRQLPDRPGGSDGVGLGLAISRTLARASGGDVTVESVVGQGSTFAVTLPRAH